MKLFYNPKWHQDTNGQKLLKDIERHITTLKNPTQQCKYYDFKNVWHKWLFLLSKSCVLAFILFCLYLIFFNTIVQILHVYLCNVILHVYLCNVSHICMGKTNGQIFRWLNISWCSIAECRNSFWSFQAVCF